MLDPPIRVFAAPMGRSNVRLVPVGDLSEAHERAAELADRRWARVDFKIVAEAGHELERQVGVAVVVAAANDFLGVPRGAHLAMGVTGPLARPTGQSLPEPRHWFAGTAVAHRTPRPAPIPVHRADLRPR